MKQKTIGILICVTTSLALVFFPNQDNFWAYVSVSYYVSICSLIVSLYLLIQQLYKGIHYIHFTGFQWKQCWMLLFFTSNGLLLFLFLPTHTMLFFFLFAFSQWREWLKQRSEILLEKKQPIKEK
jgi:hypothetical protein